MRFYAKLPSQVVALSLVACLVVIGAPALVSVVDDTYTYEGNSETQLLDIPSTMDSFIRAPTAENPIKSASVSYIPASQNDGTFVMALNDPSLASSVTYARFYGIDMAPLTSGMGTVKVVTSCDPTYVRIGLVSSDEDTSSIWMSLTKSETDPSVWTISLSSINLIKLKSGAYEYMYIDMLGQNAVFDMEIYASGEYVIPYGEIIIGLSGIVLMLCALFATPFFGVKGYTGKKFWRR